MVVPVQPVRLELQALAELEQEELVQVFLA
jgi:hypothetical protein